MAASSEESPADAVDDKISGVREVKSAARTLELLELLASRQNRPARLRELTEALNVPRSSLYALLRTLTKHGWVRTDASGTMYGIGIRALLVGTSYLDTDQHLRIVKPVLDELGEKLDETFHFGRLDGFDVVYLATRESSQYLRPYSRVGRRLPAYSTALGKALLAEHGGEQLDHHLPAETTAFTPHTITDRAALVADLDQTRARGYSIDRQESSLGLHCFGLALRYATPARDAISCSVPLARLNAELEAEILATMRQAREQIERSAPPIGDDSWV
ncbi:IclR family transcriptional regulator [Actinomadura alba]|uniref:IclR family transcriptional regulator n=1 Tax=Actinomadura alba TaxID=406431 RepID=A0ABR7LWN1_9ACTN|nr:IclR family transcriptional regulator [Actinomadura alba]MBC6469264.1 IclR family transcriptional regulator [Actinomadura alba]